MIWILFVDDSPEVRDIAQQFLGIHPDFVIDTVSSAQEALSRMEQHPYNAIISDYFMPDMDGVTFLTKVRINNPAIPFIIFTGHGEEGVVIEALNKGADFYLKKSYEIKSQFFELAQIIRLSVARAQSEEMLRKSEEKFRTIAAYSTEWMYWIDPNNSMIYVSPSCEQVTGYLPEEFYQDPDLRNRIIYAEDRILWSDHLVDHSSDKSSLSLDIRIVHKDGSLRWIGHVCQSIFDTNGNYAGRRVSNRDISSRKKTEELLLKERDNFLRVFRAAPVGLLLLNTNTEITQANVAIAEMVLRDPAEIIRKRGGGGLGCIHSLEDPRGCGYSSSCPDCPLRQGIEAVIREGISIHGAVISLTLMIEGVPTLRWLSINAEPVDIEGENYVIVAIDDITEERETEDALRDSEEHYRSLFENMFEGYAYCQMLYDDQGTPSDWIYIDVNGAFEQLTGLSDVKGRRVTEVIPGIRDQTPELIEIYNRVVVSGTPEKFEINFTPLHIWLQISVYRPKEGHFVAVFENITSRKHAEELLHKIVRDHQTILENVPAMIWFKDIHNRYIKINPAAAQVIGRPIQEIEGKALSELFPSVADTYFSRDLEVIESKMPKLGILDELYTAQGEHLWVQTDTVPLIDEQGEVIGVLVVSTDITERKMSKDAINQVNHKLNLLSGITRHDIGNQLQVIFGYLDFVKEGVLDPELKGFVEKIDESAHNIKRQLAFSRDYHDIGVLSPVWQDVRTVISQSVQTFDISPIQLLIEVSGIEIYADPLIAKVFFNLVDNAKRYGETITILRFFGFEGTQGYVIVCEDDGVGVPDEVKTKIFNHEYYKHTGFGLNLSREILEITGITIRECGEPGKGAKFEILVPAGKYRITGK
ncbi:MAG TPA: PAS domain S-box protein [Methanospirillum sp.]|nr:PAS domain S-box protein [Methanospirillum sp.]